MSTHSITGNKARAGKMKPNILIFMADQLRNDVTEAGHVCKTPNMEKLAENGIRFSNLFTTMTHCCPARASFFSGQYPSKHGVFNNVSNFTAIHRGLNEGTELFSEKLKEAGYETYFCGRWHVSALENPSERGWDEELHLVSGKRILPHEEEMKNFRSLAERSAAQGNDGSPQNGRYTFPGYPGRKMYTKTEYSSYKDNYDYKSVESGIGKLEELKDSKDPWCMYVGTCAPHEPMNIPEEFANMYNPDEIELPPNFHDELKDKPRLYGKMRKIWDSYSEREFKEAAAYYYGYVTMLDKMFGDLMDALEKSGHKDNTLVLLLSDHGELLGAHGLFMKGIPAFDEAYRIPGIISYPKGIKNPGRSVDSYASICDFCPTLTDIAEAGSVNDPSGRSLLPFLNDETPEDWDDTVYSQCNGVEIYYTQRGVWDREYKYIYNAPDVDELYDLKNDPLEMRNLIDDPSKQDIVKKYQKKMWEKAEQEKDIIHSGNPCVWLASNGPL
jgi:arylsulfatase A-like enzyme